MVAVTDYHAAATDILHTYRSVATIPTTLAAVATAVNKPLQSFTVTKEGPY